MKEQVRLFAEMFDTDAAYAKQCFSDVAEFIESVIASGDTFCLPGILTIGIQKLPPRTIYNFQTKSLEETSARYRPKIIPGRRLKKAAADAPELKDLILRKRLNEEGIEDGDE